VSYTYADWQQQTTTSAQRDRLALHIAEVAQKIGNEVGSDGKSVGSSSLTQYMSILQDQYDKLASSPGTMTGGGYSFARITRP